MSASISARSSRRWSAARWATVFGWHYGFAAAGVGMLIGLAIYLYGVAARCRRTSSQQRVRRTRSSSRSRRTNGARIWRAAVLFVPVTLVLGDLRAAGQHDRAVGRCYTDRTFNLVFWTGEIPVTWFQAFNPFMIFAFTPFVVALWARQAARGTRAVDRHQDGARLLRCRAGVPDHGRPPPGMPGGDKAELALAVRLFRGHHARRALSFADRPLARHQGRAGPLLSMMMGVWLATSFTGNFLAGWLGSFWTGMDKRDFFLMIAAIAAAAAVVILMCNGLLRRALRNRRVG